MERESSTNTHGGMYHTIVCRELIVTNILGDEWEVDLGLFAATWRFIDVALYAKLADLVLSYGDQGLAGMSSGTWKQ